MNDAGFFVSPYYEMNDFYLENVGEAALVLRVHEDLIGTQGDAKEGESGIDCGKLSLFAGFIDMHCHGAVGVDVNSADADGLIRVGEFLAANGVTAWMPTLVPDSDENYRRAVAVIDAVMAVQTDLAIAQIVGVHYEGVFANEAMCGALRPQFFKRVAASSPPCLGGVPEGRGGRSEKARASDVLESTAGSTTPSAETAASPPKQGGELLPRLRRGVHMTTLAPEIDGGIELIKRLVGDGWIVAIGHTRADWATLDRAFAAGARHLTHFFNAMTGLHHREPGVAAWGLANEGVTFDIIADGLHVHPEMLRLACRVKTADKVTLISDSVAPTGLGDGEYSLWGETVTVKNGRTQNERGSIAGSVSTMLDGVKMLRSIGFSDVEVAQMTSLNPAKLLGIDTAYGSIDVGKRADLVAIDADGNVAFTMIGGEIAWSGAHESTGYSE